MIELASYDPLIEKPEDAGIVEVFRNEDLHITVKDEGAAAWDNETGFQICFERTTKGAEDSLSRLKKKLRV